MSHLNELQEQFGDKGLSIVGVTSETASDTEPWIAKHKATYAYCYDKAAKLMSAVGASGYPSAVLVDPSGNVVWTGHPSEVNASIIEPALVGALPKPLWDWPSEAKKVKSALQKRQLGKALAEAQLMGEAGTEVRTTIEAMISSKLTRLESARDEKDWLRVQTLGTELVASFDGLPQRDQAKAIVDALKADKGAQDILKAQQRVAKIFAEDIKRKQIDKFKEDLKKISKDYVGTAAGRDADAGIEELEKLRRALADR